MKTINIKEFKDQICDFELDINNFKGNKPCIIDLYADWCAPCKSLGFKLEEIEETYSDKVDFYKINIDTNPEIADAFEVKSIPYLVLYGKNKNYSMIIGNVPKENILESINKML